MYGDELTPEEEAKADAWDLLVENKQLNDELHRVKVWRLFWAAIAVGLGLAKIVEIGLQ